MYTCVTNSCCYFVWYIIAGFKFIVSVLTDIPQHLVCFYTVGHMLDILKLKRQRIVAVGCALKGKNKGNNSILSNNFVRVLL